MLPVQDVITVSQLNAYVKDVLWKDAFLRQVVVRGEIANLRNYSGHLYFTLKDEKASVRAVMWRNDATRLAFVPKDGEQVVIAGGVSVFERDGIYQVYVSYMEPTGLGSLHAALEKLKIKLEKEGLFSSERKRPISAFPRKIGLVTSVRGAAIKDIVTCGKRRFPGVMFVAVDAKVQGAGAPQEIAAGIAALNRLPQVDVIIVGRGGGSQEDLFVFNDEIVARAIYNSRIPIVSAVGHERDVTVADLVADARAATPTHAAELVVPDALSLKTGIRNLKESLRTQVNGLLSGHRQTLRLLQARPALERPDWFLVSSRERLVRLRENLESFTKSKLERDKNAFGAVVSNLDALSPLRILSRGYSFAQKLPEESIVREYSQAPPQSQVKLTLYKGSLTCLVLKSEDTV